jgi:hypothetical protein
MPAVFANRRSLAWCCALVCVLAACQGRRAVVGRPSIDAGDTRVDGGAVPDAGSAADAAGFDAGPPFDAGAFDAGPFGFDGGRPDAGRPDAGRPDAGRPDAGGVDAGGDDLVTIDAIQRGLIAEGTLVRFAGVVTGISSQGAWVQDPTTGPMYSGVKVYTGVAPGVVRGDRVEVEGTVLEYFGDTEIDDALITRTGAGVVTPAAVTVATALTEPYEGVLVRLTDVTSHEPTYDCSLDNPACFDDELWRVNASLVVYPWLYEGAAWAAQIRTRNVTGVMTWRFDRRRIMPRTDADFGP